MGTKKNFLDANGNIIEDMLCVEEDSHGLMCPEDKIKLAGIETGAQVNTIDAISSEFIISEEGKILNIDAIDQAKVDGLTDALDDKVDLESDQNISGVKTFDNGLTIGNVNLTYDAEEKAFKILFLASESETETDETTTTE